MKPRKLVLDRCRLAVEPLLHSQVERGLVLLGFQILPADTMVGPTRRDELLLLGALRITTTEDVGAGESEPVSVRPHVLKGTALWERLCRPMDSAMWLPVLELETLTRLGVEIYAASDEDATSQLDALALALDRPRGTIEIKPRLGWCGYGDPDLHP